MDGLPSPERISAGARVQILRANHVDADAR